MLENNTATKDKNVKKKTCDCEACKAFNRSYEDSYVKHGKIGKARKMPKCWGTLVDVD